MKGPAVQVRTMNEGKADEFERMFLFCPDGHEVGSTPASSRHAKAWLAGDFTDWSCGHGGCGWGDAEVVANTAEVSRISEPSNGVGQWTVEHWEDGSVHTRCPVCSFSDEIAEVDIATRCNRLTLADDGLSAVASTGDGEWEFDDWQCMACGAVDLTGPDGFTITDWY